MRVFTPPVCLLTLAIPYTLSQTTATSQTTLDAPPSFVAYWSPFTTLPPEPIPTPAEYLELRAAPAAQPAVPAAQPAAAAPVAPAVPAAAAPAAPAAPVAPAAAAPAAQAPAGAAPAVGVGGAGGAPAAAQPAATNPTQVPTITSYQVPTVIGGVTKQVPVVYTQVFSSVPSQGPTPIPGTIGLGTLTGTVGAVRTAQAKKGAASRSVLSGIGPLALGTGFVVLRAMAIWI